MQATLKDVGKVDADALYGNPPRLVRCELVDAGRHSDEFSAENPDLDIAKGYAQNIWYKRHCRIGRVRVAKWIAIDPVELRHQDIEPPLGAELL